MKFKIEVVIDVDVSKEDVIEGKDLDQETVVDKTYEQVMNRKYTVQQVIE